MKTSVFLFALGCCALAQSSVERYRVVELELASTQNYSNAYRDVEVDAVFSHADGLRISRPAFWYRDDIWKVRFAPTDVGDWTWETKCSNPNDAGLHARTGTVSCVAYTGDLPIYQHGFVALRQQQRYFTYADGTPFFWMGDTHWQMPNTHRIDACNHPEHQGGACPHGGQFQHIVSNRLGKGFNVWQTYPAIAAEDGAKFWWIEPWNQLNPGRFNREFDFEMKYLADHGFVIALGLDHYRASEDMPLGEMKRMARYIVARYGAYPVVWITAQEINKPSTDLDYWKAVAAEIDRLDGYNHPLSGHQWVLQVDQRSLGHEPWHDWFAVQGGHGGNSPQSKGYYKSYWDFQPSKPFVETEANYELVQCGGKADASGVRWQAYKAIQCGSCGYTYGGAGIWACRWDRNSKWENYNVQVWFEGLDLPGSTQMKHLKTFYTQLDWWKFEPRWNDPAWGDWFQTEETVVSSDGDHSYVVYFYHSDPATGTLKHMAPAGIYAAAWFNPRTGEYTQIPGSIQPMDGQWAVPSKPDSEDWVLLVQQK